MKKVFFVINPKAGKGQVKNSVLDVLDVFSEAGICAEVYITQGRNDGRKRIADVGSQCDMVVSAGGDGTLSETVKALMEIEEEKRPVLGYIPGGTANDFATSLEIPKNPVKAAEMIVKGKEFRCDVGCFNGEHFVYIAAFGAFTDVSYDTPQEEKNLLGHLAYIIEGIKRMPNITGHRMKVEFDGQVIDNEFLYGMVCNTYSVAGIASLKNENVVLDDGLFEVILVKMPKSTAEFQALVTALVMKDLSSDAFYSFKAKKVKFYSENEVAWTLDGEYGGMHREVEVENCQKAIGVLVGEELEEK
ncbi:MAG: YegS/Rv2252/BmrU family lipid kinase [Firmicutes bacterium]|nr:YegS/Rv2252/BmrU family lipid kinase [Bacillota bacterium]